MLMDIISNYLILVPNNLLMVISTNCKEADTVPKGYGGFIISHQRKYIDITKEDLRDKARSETNQYKQHNCTKKIQVTKT
jgi:hypothetical protein